MCFRRGRNDVCLHANGSLLLYQVHVHRQPNFHKVNFLTLGVTWVIPPSAKRILLYNRCKWVVVCLLCLLGVVLGNGQQGQLPWDPSLGGQPPLALLPQEQVHLPICTCPIWGSSSWFLITVLACAHFTLGGGYLLPILDFGFISSRKSQFTQVTDQTVDLF